MAPLARSGITATVVSLLCAAVARGALPHSLPMVRATRSTAPAVTHVVLSAASRGVRGSATGNAATAAKRSSAADKAVTPAKRRKKTADSPRAPSSSKPTIDPPIGWQSTYDLITELRADRTAVVDSMGSEAIAADAPPADREYQALISLMLSSQTKDIVNMATMKKLRAHPDGLSLGSVLAMEEDTLHEMIRQVGFHNNKVKYIKRATQMIADEHGGRVLDTMDALLTLPGVGPKMAIILLRVAFGQVVGISVDTHVHRIANQLGWAGAAGTKQPEQTRAALESWMPREIWPDVNLLLVGLGQEVQTEKAKLLAKCASCSDPPRALRLASTLGVAVGKELRKAGLDVPQCVDDENL